MPATQNVSPHHTAARLNEIFAKPAGQITLAELRLLNEALTRIASGAAAPDTPLETLFP